MRKILVMLVAIAMFAGFAMAETKDIGEMTALEKYGEAGRLWKEDREASSALYEEIKDNEELDNNLRAHSYMLADLQSVEYARAAVDLADETNWARGHRLSFLVKRTEGEEQEEYINEMVRLAGQFPFPYESIVIPLLVQRDRLDDAKAVAKTVLGSPRVGVFHINNAMTAFEPKEVLDILINNFPNVRKSANYVPELDEKTGKLKDEPSIVGATLDLIASPDIELADKDKALTRIASLLSIQDPAQRIMLEAVLSERDAVRKIME
jgi:Ni/Co efflux regulator RcnB